MHDSWVYESHLVQDVVDLQIPEEDFHVGETLLRERYTHQSFIGLKLLKYFRTGTYTHLVRDNNIDKQ